MTLTTLRLSESGARVAYRTAGAGDVVVLLHGVGMISAAWQPQIDALSQTHRVIAPDLPGHGQSDPLPTGSDLAAFVAWFAEVARALEVKPFNLVGHSMGALITLGFAATHPDYVQRIALLNGVFRRSPDARAAVIARAADIAAGRADLQAPLARWFGNATETRAARDDVAKWLKSMELSGYATAYDAFARGDDTYADALPRIACPVLALTADGDANSTPAMAHAMADAAPQGRAAVIKGHRHMVPLTAPDQVNAHLLDWLHTPVAPMVQV